MTTIPTHSNQKKILLLSLSGIGNFIMQSPVFEALKQRYPQYHLTVWVGPRGTNAFAAHNPHIDRVLEAPPDQSWWQQLRFLRLLAREKFDIGIVLSPGQLIKSAAYLFLARIPLRIGNVYPFLGARARSWLLTHAILEDAHLHDIEQNMQLLAPLGIAATKEPRHYTLPLPSAAHASAQRLLQKLAVPPSALLVGMHPGSLASMPWKRWPLPYFAEVAHSLIKNKGAYILIFGGPDEQAVTQKLHRLIGSHSATIESDLLTAAALITYCGLFISNDSGLMHVAAATGVPTYGLFGPTDEVLTSPRGAQSFVLRASGTKPVYHTELRPALGSDTHETLRQLTPQMVLEKLH